MIILGKNGQRYILGTHRQCPRSGRIARQLLEHLEEIYARMLVHGSPGIYTDFDFRPNETQLINKQVNNSNAEYLTRIKHMTNYTMTSLMGNKIPEKSK